MSVFKNRIVNDVANACAEIIAPTRCAGCDIPGRLLCQKCYESIAEYPAGYACQKCGAPFGELVCTECWDTEFAFEAALAIGPLDGPLARAVVLHKDGNERRLGMYLGAWLGEVVSTMWPEWPDVITWIPPSNKAYRRRGFDHGKSLALGVSRVLGVEPQISLARLSSRDMRTLSRKQRQSVAAHSFDVVEPVHGAVLLVDDVMTTGSTAQGATVALLQAGADAVRVATVARTW